MQRGFKKNNASLLDKGLQLDSICKLSYNATPDGLMPVYDVMAKYYMQQGQFAKAAAEAKILSDFEENSYPHVVPGNATLLHVLIYADALKMSGKKAEACKHIERVLSKVNKAGQIPESSKFPDRQKAVACDILSVYRCAIKWFKDNGMPNLAEKYARISREFAKFYQVQFDPYSTK